jgi:hypothetical protein
MVPDFVSDHVGLSEIAGSAVALGQFVEKGQVDVDLLIGGAVEGADGRLGQPARRLDAAAVDQTFSVSRSTTLTNLNRSSSSGVVLTGPAGAACG